MIRSKDLVKLIRVFLGAVFVLSAVAKILSIVFFDDLVAKQLLGENYLSNFQDNFNEFYYIQWLTRAIIAGEFMLGVAVLQDKHLKKIVLPTIIVLLLAFIVQVVYAASFQGKGYIDGNCGCFGDIIPFDNLETIIKNVVMIAMALLAMKWYKEGEYMNLPPVIIPYVVGIVTFITLCIPVEKMEPVVPVSMINSADFTPITETVDIDTLSKISDSTKLDSLLALKIDSAFSKEVNTDSKINGNSTMDLPSKTQNDDVDKSLGNIAHTKQASIFAPFTNFSGGVIKNLDEGTHIIGLFSYVCEHCQETYRDILELQKRNDSCGNLYIMGYGSEFDKMQFWNQADGVVSPHITLEDYTEFGKILNGSDFPKVIIIKDGVKQKEWDLDSYSKESMFEYFGVKAEVKDATPNSHEISIPDKKKEIEFDHLRDEGFSY